MRAGRVICVHLILDAAFICFEFFPRVLSAFLNHFFPGISIPLEMPQAFWDFFLSAHCIPDRALSNSKIHAEASGIHKTSKIEDFRHPKTEEKKCQ